MLNRYFKHILYNQKYVCNMLAIKNTVSYIITLYDI